MSAPITVAYLGAFYVPWTTESHVTRSLRSLGADVTELPADRPDSFRRLERLQGKVDLVLVSRACDWPRHRAEPLLRQLEDHGAITAAYDLDRFVGLPRIGELRTKALFATGHLFGADGHPSTVAAYEAAGIDFHHLPPGVVHDETTPGRYRRRWAGQVAFVGSRRYHAEWPHRPEMVDFLERTYGEGFVIAGDGNPTVREAELNDLYASVDVAVGDSMLLHGAEDRYCSDRVFETLGRAGFLIHPQVDWLDDLFGGLLPSWPLGDWAALEDEIGRWRANPSGRATRMAELHALVVEHHTYRSRMVEMLGVLGLMDSRTVVAA